MAKEVSPNPADPARSGLRWGRMLKLIAILVVGFLVFNIGPGWIKASTPRWLQRGFILSLCYALIFSYGLILLVSPIGLVVSILRIRSARRARRPWERSAKILFLSLSGLMILAIGDLVSRSAVLEFHRVPRVPRVFPDAVPRSDRSPLSILVIGESSARGEPYDPWISIGDIVAWKLRSVFPDREIKLKIMAAGGICLEQAISRLRELRERPDLMIVYAGHNEFQARFGWDRNGAHYVGEFTPKSIVQRSIDFLASISNTSAFAREILDRQRIDQTPLPQATRGLIDHPAFSASEYDFLRDDFHWRLNWVVDYCDEVGATPVLIYPASNDTDYPPNRSYLASEMTEADREAFAREFQAASALEKTEPAKALEAYRALANRHPEFAETHFRLGTLLRSAGKSEEARAEFEQARDRDGMPMRCPTDFRTAYTQTAAKHPRSVYVDAAKTLRAVAPDGMLGNTLFHDGQHPNLKAYTLIANEVLKGIAAQEAIHWPKGTPAPVATPREVADHFGMNAERWAEVVKRSIGFYVRTGSLRFESSAVSERIRQYEEAVRKVEAGEKPETVGLGDLGL